ncbi:MAG: hypothetical protein ACI8RP_000108 [Urechidicola sp.]|jgi:hypothetical protein
MIYLYVLLLRIIAYLEGPAKIILFVIVFGIIGWSVIKRTKFGDINKVSKVKLYSFLTVIIILIHGFIFGVIYLRDFAVLMTYWVWFVFTYTYLKDKTIEEALKYVFYSFLIFNVANYLFFELYYADQKFGINSILGVFGVFGYRIYFPLASGANVFTFQVGVNALISLYFIKYKSRNILYIAVYWFYLFVLVLADSRLILVMTIFFSITYWFSFKTIIAFFKKYWYVLSIFIVAFLFIFYNSSLFDGFKRANEKTGLSISRLEIWGYAIDVLISDFRIILGHGLNGLEMGLDETLKAKFETQNLQTSHNFIIQNIIDFGLVGLVIILFYIFKLVNMLIKLKSQIITTIVVMFLLIGTTESIPTFYSFEPTIFMIALISIILVNYERKIIRHP